MAMRVCTILSPHQHPKGAEGSTVIVHNVDRMSDPDESLGEETDAEE